MRRTLLVALGLVALWFVLGAVQLARAWSDAQDVREQLRALQHQVELVHHAVDSGENDDRGDDLDLDAMATRLTEAGTSMRRLDDSLNSPLVWPYRVVPGLARQVESARSLASTSREVAEAGDTLVRAVREVEAGNDAPARAAAYRRLADGALALRAAARSDLGPSSFLLPPLRKARAQAADLLDQLSEPADALAETVPGVADFLTGSHDYLLLSANNTESAGFSGRYLQIGWLRARSGSIHADALRDSNEPSELLTPGTVPLADADWSRNWGWLQPSSLFTELGTTSRFPVTASTAARMWSVRTGQPVDGVASIDIRALVDVVEAGGSVRFRGREMSADEVEQYLLTDQYRIADTATRRRLLAHLTDAVLGTIQKSETTDVFGLVRALHRAISGRHLMLWSPSTHEQQAWAAIGADGVPPGDSINIGTSTLLSKLDHRLHFTVTARQREVGDDRMAELEIAIHNTATGAEPAYLLAHPRAVGRTPGTYAGFLVVDLPGAARRVAIDSPPNVNGPDGEQTQVSTFIEIPPSTTRTVTVRFVLPATEDLTVAPSARIPSVRWRLGDRERSDETAFTTALDSWGPLRGPGPKPLTEAEARRRLALIDAGLGPIADFDVDTLAAMVVGRAGSTSRDSLLGDQALSGVQLPDLLTLLRMMSQKRFYEQQLD